MTKDDLAPADELVSIYKHGALFLLPFQTKQARESVKSENCFAEKQALLQEIRESEKLLF